MSLELQMNLKRNPNYLYYLHNNSNWFKYLNRQDIYFKAFEEEAKKNMNLRFQDRIVNALNTIEMLENVISTLK